MTIQNLGSKGTAVDILPNDVLASTGNGSGVDLQGYEGDAAFIFSAEAGGSGVTVAMKIQESADNSSWSDVTDGGFTTTSANTAAFEQIALNVSDLKRYVRAASTVAGGTGTGAVNVTAYASKKYTT
tara:strand:- start:4699 stop:5079 length:381 start_codon:yes stop_codon:yes gene_type:complete